MFKTKENGVSKIHIRYMIKKENQAGLMPPTPDLEGKKMKKEATGHTGPPTRSMSFDLHDA